MSRPKRWAAAVSDAQDALGRLKELQEEYQDWLDNLPEGLDQSPVAEKLEAVTELEIEDAEAMLDEASGIDLPLGFGRD